ncbi:efflux RND transporter periplasmic adaptor subunit [candidate division KSB1 bacterium]|nr:efflux RND transporter periplasmic adaptor subunit [candidate division KSB1 bacterium]NIR70345.1 efflux RND transporter periplasmic adaptor subunit [candidate division KSB1 bacterium]NIS23115.1 efflux RND transporter periplasmic adaptor subunit [candidate division KSB1 bacterium]NIT69950.1 efflux RND transporter periplasmic adaptor subunit [candidate division KSB1 bacterium]NIU23607.1 efflux RND transporter periplasmic adaptor subunit [candidate division KSB1 bacterium]
MRILRLLTVFVVPSVLLASLLSLSCGKNGEAKDKSNPEENTVLIPVEVSQASRDDISAYLTGTATIEAEHEAEVVAKTSGIIEEILVEEGVFVEKGQVLARLEEEMLAIATEKAKADLDKLENDFNRNKELFEKRLISKEEFQNVRFQYEAQKAEFKQAKLNLKYASIRAPITGVIARRYIKAGNMIEKNQPAFRIVDFEDLIANVYVPEVEIQKVEVGQRAELNLDATNGSVFEGYVDRISPIVDPASGTVRVTVAIKNPNSYIKPGMFVRIRIIHDTHQNSLLIPKQAVISEDGTDLVYSIEDSIAVKKAVKTGYSSDTRIEILDGLSSGEQVVVVGQNGLKDSSKVEIVQ